MKKTQNKLKLKDKTIVSRFLSATENRDFRSFEALIQRMGILYSFKPFGSFLHLACALVNPDQIDYLITHGVPVNLENDEGKRPIDYLLSQENFKKSLTTTQFNTETTIQIDEIAQTLIQEGSFYLTPSIFSQALKIGLPRLVQTILDSLDANPLAFHLDKSPLEICLEALLADFSIKNNNFILNQVFSSFNSNQPKLALNDFSHYLNTIDVILNHPHFDITPLKEPDYLTKICQESKQTFISFSFNSIGQTSFERVENSFIIQHLQHQLSKAYLQKTLPENDLKSKIQIRL